MLEDFLKQYYLKKFIKILLLGHNLIRIVEFKDFSIKFELGVNFL